MRHSESDTAEMNTDPLLSELKEDEGWRESVYFDHLGYASIGWGFMIDARKGGKLPKPVAEFWIRYLVNEKLDALRKLWPPFENQPAEVKLALANMAYQMGADGVLEFRRMIAALEAGDRATAADEAEDSTWFTQTPKRARRVIGLLRGA